MTKFSDLKLDPKVLKAVAEAGYETPTPIQAGAIPPALEGRDVLGIAQTGTGKTASFTLPMITLLGRGRARARMPRSLVLCPTRELAAQVAENFDIYASQTRLTKALLIGGVSFAEQDKLIDRGVDVLIATPGRLLDHFERGKLLLTGVQIMVVDEADRMLDMGFIPDIERIFQLTPFTRQTLFFSATMAPEIERITNTFLHAPERIEVARQATASETITQRLVEITPTRRDLASKQKRELLRALIDAEGPETEQGGLKNAIIFCNRKTDVDIVAKSLAKHGYDAAPIHGDLDQSHRTRTLESFRDGRLKLLIASDVAARGLDIPAVSHVFNFDLPSHAEDYVHRIGRTGRAGRLGTAISIGTPADDKYLTAIESLLKQSLPRGTVPEGFTLSEDGGRTRDGGRSSGRDRDDDRRGGRDRRGRGRREDERPQEVRKSEARDDRRRGSEADNTPRPDAPRAEQPRAEQARAEQGRAEQAREQDRGQDRGRDRGRDQDRRGRNRGNDHRGPAVMGLGDHVPQFMLVELRSADFPLRDDSTDEAEADAPLPAAKDTAAEAPEKALKERSARSKSRSRRRSASAPDEAEAATATETAPIAEADHSIGDAAVSAPTVEAPTEDTPAETEAEAEAAPAKPKRSRRKKTDEAAAEPATPAEAEKPKRRSRKKAEPTPAVASDAAEDAPAKTPAPRRSRRKKAETAEDAPTASETADRADAEA